jgi:hypothetical protein
MAPLRQIASSSFIWTNSFFDTIGGDCLWPRSKPCSGSEPATNPRHMSKYEAQPTFPSHLTTPNHKLLWLAETTG